MFQRHNPCDCFSSNYYVLSSPMIHSPIEVEGVKEGQIIEDLPVLVYSHSVIFLENTVLRAREIALAQMPVW